MIGYKDKAWCVKKDCDNTCGRRFTEADHKKATKWWGNEGYPIIISDFHKKETEKWK